MSTHESDISPEALPEGPVTLMFTDVESSTELTSKIGDEGWRDLVNKHHETVRAIASEHGGREIKSLGDGLMLAFTSARRAVQASVAIQDALSEATAQGQPFKVRIGLNTGEVAHDQGDMLGTAVNAAARIAARAEGGQVLAAEVVKQLVGTIPGIEFRDRGRVTLKGFSERWRLFEITSTRVRERSDRTQFIGRDEERSELKVRLDAALAGRGSVVMLGGEPGIGKTRLAEEIGAEARARGALALIGRCQDVDSPLPYAPWVEMTNTIARIAPREVFRQALGEDASEIARLAPEIRRMFPDVAEPLRLPPEQERQYLFNSIVNYLERSSRIQPLMFILDDLQWADDASLLLLKQVAERVAEMPILIIGTYRDIELEVARPLARTLEDLLRRRLVHRVSLRRFSEEGVERLLLALAQRLLPDGGRAASSPPPALVKVIYRETEGNPFFVEEVFQHLNEEGRLFTSEGSWLSDVAIEEFEVPESIRLVIGRRLEKLGEETRRVLTTAALIGPSFSYQLLEELEGDDPDVVVDAIDEAEAAHLISSSRRGMETRVAFGHELIRQTLLSGVSLPRRQRLHLKIAEAMEKSYSERGLLVDHAIEVAHHLYQAAGSADPAKTASYLSLAGDLSINAAAFDEARKHYEQALEFHTNVDATFAELHFKLGYAQRGMGRWDDALVSWNRSLSLYERLEDRTGGRVARGIAYQFAWVGRTEEALEAALRGLSIVQEVDVRERARLLAVAAMAQGLLGNPEAYSMIEEAEEIAKGLDHERSLLEVQSARGVIEWAFIRPLPCLEVSTPAMERFKARGDLFQWVGLCPFVEQALTVMGRFKEADALADEYAPVAEKIGHLGALLPHRRASAQRKSVRTPEELMAAAEQDQAEVQRVGGAWIGQSLAWKSSALFLKGDWEESLEIALGPALEEVKGVYEKMNPAGLALGIAIMGYVDEAVALLDGAAAPEDLDAPIPSGRKMLLASAPDVLAFAGDHERAATFYPFLGKLLRDKLVFGFFSFRPIHLGAAAAAAAASDWPAAEKLLNEAIAVCEDRGLTIHVPTCLYVWGTVLGQWAPERRAEVRSVMQKAIEGYEAHGMDRHAEMVRSKLKELSER